MRVLVAGNSHVGALRGAVLPPKLQAHEVDFFAVSAGCPVLEQGLLVPSEGGRLYSTAGERVDPRSYDAILVSAVGVHAMRSHVPHPLFTMKLPGWGGDLPVVSTAVFREVVRHRMLRFPTVQLALGLGRLGGPALFFQPWPLPCVTVLDEAGWKLRELHGERVQEALAHWYAVQDEQLHALLGGIGTVLDYPRRDWLAQGVTPFEFRTPDPWHMNQAYGALVLEQLAAQLDRVTA